MISNKKKRCSIKKELQETDNWKPLTGNIANNLSVSPHTVRNHYQELTKKGKFKLTYEEKTK